MTDNIFRLPPNLPNEEVFEEIVKRDRALIERIISTGQSTPPDEWYDQEQDEWVILLQGEAQLAYSDGTTLNLNVGDYVWLPAHQKHRVAYTSSDPPCIWLAVHF